MRTFNPCPDLRRGSRGRRRRKRQTSPGEAQTHVLNLWPWSPISAGVLAKNAKAGGEMSDVLEFNTPEGCRQIYA